MSDDSQVTNDLMDVDEDRDEPARGVSESRLFVLEDFTDSGPAIDLAHAREACGKANHLRVEFSAMAVPRSDVESWQPGALVPFEEPSSATVRVFLGETLVAHGELIEVDGEFGVEVVELMETAGQKAA